MLFRSVPNPLSKGTPPSACRRYAPSYKKEYIRDCSILRIFGHELLCQIIPLSLRRNADSISEQWLVTTAHILKLAYVKLQYSAVITANFMQTPLKKVSIVSNVHCSVRIPALFFDFPSQSIFLFSCAGHGIVIINSSSYSSSRSSYVI